MVNLLVVVDHDFPDGLIVEPVGGGLRRPSLARRFAPPVGTLLRLFPDEGKAWGVRPAG